MYHIAADLPPRRCHRESKQFPTGGWETISATPTLAYKIRPTACARIHPRAKSFEQGSELSVGVTHGISRTCVSRAAPLVLPPISHPLVLLAQKKLVFVHGTRPICASTNPRSCRRRRTRVADRTAKFVVPTSSYPSGQPPIRSTHRSHTHPLFFLPLNASPTLLPSVAPTPRKTAVPAQHPTNAFYKRPLSLPPGSSPTIFYRNNPTDTHNGQRTNDPPRRMRRSPYLPCSRPRLGCLKPQTGRQMGLCVITTSPHSFEVGLTFILSNHRSIRNTNGYTVPKGGWEETDTTLEAAASREALEEGPL